MIIVFVFIIIVFVLFLMNVGVMFFVLIIILIVIVMVLVIMVFMGLFVNLMLFGGIVVVIGMLVDGFVVMVENIFKWLSVNILSLYEDF